MVPCSAQRLLPYKRSRRSSVPFHHRVLPLCCAPRPASSTPHSNFHTPLPLITSPVSQHGCAYSSPTTSITRLWPNRPYAPKAARGMDSAMGQRVCTVSPCCARVTLLPRHGIAYPATRLTRAQISQILLYAMPRPDCAIIDAQALPFHSNTHLLTP
jgi:hypothetical protein